MPLPKLLNFLCFKKPETDSANQFRRNRLKESPESSFHDDSDDDSALHNERASNKAPERSRAASLDRTGADRARRRTRELQHRQQQSLRQKQQQEQQSLRQKQQKQQQQQQRQQNNQHNHNPHQQNPRQQAPKQPDQQRYNQNQNQPRPPKANQQQQKQQHQQQQQQHQNQQKQQQQHHHQKQKPKQNVVNPSDAALGQQTLHKSLSVDHVNYDHSRQVGAPVASSSRSNRSKRARSKNRAANGAASVADNKEPGAANESSQARASVGLESMSELNLAALKKASRMEANLSPNLVCNLWAEKLRTEDERHRDICISKYLELKSLMLQEGAKVIERYANKPSSNAASLECSMDERIEELTVENNAMLNLLVEGELRAESYVDRFHNLLLIEEMEARVRAHKLDLKGKTLEKGEDMGSFLLELPKGLAVNGCNLSTGDEVIVNTCDTLDFYKGILKSQSSEGVLVIALNSKLDFVLKNPRQKFDIYFRKNTNTLNTYHRTLDQVDEDEMVFDILFPSGAKLAPPKSVKVSSSFKHYENLDEQQERAICNLMRSECRPAPYLLMGPPGSGKTRCLVEAVLRLFGRDNKSKILVCGSSNFNTTVLAKLILKADVVPPHQMIRLAAFSRMDKLASSNVKQISKPVHEMKEQDYLETRIIITTCGTASKLPSKMFDYILIDDAWCSVEPESLISVVHLKPGGLVVLSGHEHQLRPEVSSRLAREGGLATSLMERLYRNQPPYKRLDERFVTKLTTCHRADPRVQGLINELLFEGKLKFGKTQTPEGLLAESDIDYPLIFHSIGDQEDMFDEEDLSWSNEADMLACVGYVQCLYGADLEPHQVGIITPYEQQIEKISDNLNRCRLDRCKIGTLEGFRFDEKEVIIISTVRTYDSFDEQPDSRFMTFLNEFALLASRSKWLTILIGDERIFRLNKYWNEYINEACKFDRTFSKIH